MEETTLLLRTASPEDGQLYSLMFTSKREEDLTKAAQSVFAGWLLVVLSTLTASYLVLADPYSLPPDFIQKGTLSNSSQDIRTPHGRLFAVGLVFAGIFMLNSNYTHSLYHSWAPGFSIEKNPFDSSALQPKNERRLRGTWLVLPQVGFMLTGALPALSNAQGTENVLVILHSILAPLAMAFMVIMETVQLAHGEKAFVRFSGKTFDQPLLNRPLIASQKWRVVTCSGAWVTGLGFLALQIYIGSLDILFGTPNKSYAVAVTSYLLEVTCLVLAFFIPAATAIEDLYLPTDVVVATRLGKLDVR